MSEIVYSTDPDWCAKCKSIPCRCKKSQAPAKPGKGPMKMRLEKSGRGGKAVTVIFELGMAPDQGKELQKKLQKACGTGGTYKDGRIEIQGDFRDRIEAELAQLGFKVKRAGG